MSEIKDVRWRLVENEQHKATTPPPFPKKMLAELTNACNHPCIFCGNRKMTRPIPAEMRERLPGLPVDAGRGETCAPSAAGEARRYNPSQ